MQKSDSLRNSLKHKAFHCFESRSAIRETRRRKMRFEFAEQRVALGIRGGFKSNALFGVRSECRRRGKIGAAQPAKPRQDFPTQLIKHIRLSCLHSSLQNLASRQGTASAVPNRHTSVRGFNPCGISSIRNAPDAEDRGYPLASVARCRFTGFWIRYWRCAV
jgi:hypothetical protein